MDLAILDNHQRLVLKQKKEMLEYVFDVEGANKYKIMDENGTDILYVLEETECCMRYWCGAARAFNFHVVEPQSGRAIITLQSEMRCCCGTQDVRVESPPGNVIGHVFKEFAWCTPTIQIRDANGQTLFKIPSNRKACCGSFKDLDFNVRDSSGQEVAVVTKKYGGFLKEAFTDADTFSIQYQVPLSSQVKALLLAAALHIDMVFYETSHRRKHGGGGDSS